MWEMLTIPLFVVARYLCNEVILYLLMIVFHMLDQQACTSTYMKRMYVVVVLKVVSPLSSIRDP